MNPLPQTPKAQVLGVHVDTLSREAVLRRSAALIMGANASMIVTANALLLLEAEKNPALADACRSADIVTADSVGLVWAAATLRQPSLPRLPGIDLAADLCGEAARLGQSVFLFGAAPGVAEAAAVRLRKAVPGLSVTGTRNGFYSEADVTAIVAEMAASGARLFLVALGTPKQELFIHRLRHALPAGLYVGVGGSFDVWSGKLKRAPIWMQTAGLEWLFRLFQEPARYGRMIHLPVFAWRVQKEKAGLK